jgi:hypothetical protein
MTQHLRLHPVHTQVQVRRKERSEGQDLRAIGGEGDSSL